MFTPFTLRTILQLLSYEIPCYIRPTHLAEQAGMLSFSIILVTESRRTTRVIHR